MDVKVTTLVQVIFFSCCFVNVMAIFECGVTAIGDPNKRIVGGYPTKKRAHPWVVNLNFGTPTNDNLGTRGGHICGGILLHQEWVLTAAHCLDIPGKRNTFPKSPPKDWRVTAGVHTRSKKEELEGNWQTSAIKRFIYHTGFYDYNIYSVNDIALIQLAKPFHYNEYVRPICLPNKRTLSPGWNGCYTAGWGTEYENSTHYSLKLQEVPMPIIKNKHCSARYPNKFFSGQHICGGDWYNGNMDSCKGDSGGPLSCKLKNGAWYVAGIVSWGGGCGRTRTPGVYTNVQAYESWIIQVVRKFTIVPSPSGQPKAYISERNKRKRKRSVRGQSYSVKDFNALASSNLLADIYSQSRRKRSATPTIRKGNLIRLMSLKFTNNVNNLKS